jgi:hypothetical protein
MIASTTIEAETATETLGALAGSMMVSYRLMLHRYDAGYSHILCVTVSGPDVSTMQQVTASGYPETDAD